MNETRTFGVEMEMYVDLNHDQVKNLLNEVLSQFDHHAVTRGYYNSADRGNFNRWEVKPDGSLRSAPSGYRGVEIVSPILKGHNGLQVLKAVCEAITPHAVIKSDCGLHVHHGVDSNEIREIVRGWVACEGILMEALPRSRRNNHYARRLSGYRDFLETMERGNVRTAWRNTVNDRFMALNLESFWVRGTVEIRCAAGTHEYPKVANWILITQAIIEASVGGRLGGKDVREIQTLIDTLLVVNEVPVNAVVNPYRRGSKIHALAEMVRVGGYTRNEMTGLLDHAFGFNPKHRKYVAERLCEIRKYGARWPMVERDGRVYLDVAEPEAVESPAVDNDYRDACDWLNARYDHFRAAA